MYNPKKISSKPANLENSKILDFRNCPTKVEPIPNNTKTELKPKKKPTKRYKKGGLATSKK